MNRRPILALDGVAKSFRMHLRGGMVLPVLDGVAFTVAPGECVVLGGPSGTGKSSLLRMIFGNYAADRGSIRVDTEDGEVDVATASPRTIVELRRTSVAYVSQFLRVVPRVPAQAIVAEPLIASGTAEEDALRRAREMLLALNLPEHLHALPPATFSGGEQQRVNIARGLIVPRRLLLLDEPTASLDARNRAAVVSLILERKRAGGAIVGIFHDDEVRASVADRVVDVTAFAPTTRAV